MSTVVLVHSPLVGPATWDSLGPAIRAQGFEVSIPDLTSLLEAGPPYLPRQVDAIVDSISGPGATLIGHSGAGPLLASAGAALEAVGGYAFIDAGLPTPGRTWLESVPLELAAQLNAMADDGWLPPWPEWWSSDDLAELLPDPDKRARFVADCPRLPMAMFEEVHPPLPRWPDAPCAYLRLSHAYRDSAEDARALGWPVVELDSHHLAVFSDADSVVGPVLDLVNSLIRR